MINIKHLSKFVVNLNLVIMFKPDMYFYFHGSFFFSVVGCIARGTLHFYSGVEILV